MKIINKSLISLSLIALISFCASCNKNQESFSTNKEDSKETFVVGEPEYTILDDEELDINVDPNGEDYDIDNVMPRKSPLKDKTIYWLGSSVTYGSASDGVSMADYIARLTKSNFKKDAVSGTTIFSDGSSVNSGEKSYTSRLTNSEIFDKNEKIDAFICQISTNDCISANLAKRGRMTSKNNIDPKSFDLKTSLGGIEYIITYVSETWNCPIYFYSGAYFSDGSNKEQRQNNNPKGSDYAAFIDQVKEIADKYNEYIDYHVEIIDLFNDEDFNKQASDKYYRWATSDPIHPKKAGYLEWWSPFIRNCLEKSFIE
jgi:lysophospholipase L1-like esterase